MDMISFIMHLNVQFTDEEKKACLPTVDRMVELAEKARQMGILAFEGDMAGEDDIFMKTVLSHMVDGLNWASIEEALQVMILSEKYEGAELLRRLIIVMGAKSILNGDNPRIIEGFLLSMLGEKYYKNYETLINESGKKGGHIVREFLDKLDTDMSETGENEFERLFLDMNDMSVQRVFYEIPHPDMFYYLTKALKGTRNWHVWRKALYNLSTSMQLRFIDDFESLQDFADSDETKAARIRAAQQRIVDVIRALENQGEIVIWERRRTRAEFENIAKLADRTIQRILSDVNNADLAVALKDCSDEMKSAIFRNISERLREMIEDDMEIMGPVCVRDVEDAQRRIVNTVRKLERMGEIILSAGAPKKQQ